MQREQLFGGLVAIVGVAVAAVGGYSLTHPAGSASAQVADAGHTSSVPSVSASRSPAAASSPSSAASPAGDASLSSSAASTARAPLIVLNNTTTKGLAGRAASRFEAAGWDVRSVGNLRDDILSSCAYYDPDQSGAKQAANALRAQFPGLKRVAPRFSGLPDGPVVVVLTPDWS